MIRRSLPLLTLLLILAVAASPAAAPAAVLPADSTAVISGTPDLQSLLPSPVADSSSGPHAVSADGTYVVFASRSDGLAADDDDDVQSVYRKNLLTGEVQLMSRASDVNGVPGAPSHVDCGGAAISPDGLAVAFTCTRALDPADDNGFAHAYVRNLITGQTALVDRAIDGGAGNADAANSETGALAVTHTASGASFVVFGSRASNLVGGPQGTLASLFRREIDQDGTATTLLLTGDVADAVNPSISDDGSKVAFDSPAQFDPTAHNTANAVFVSTISNGSVVSTTLVSRASGAAGAIGTGPSSHGVISGDGSAVAFDTANPYDGTHDSGTDQDVYVRRLGSSPTTTLVDVTADGAKADGASAVSAIDTTGDAVAFTSTATNLAGDSSPGIDAFVNAGAGAVLVSQAGGASTGPGFGEVPDGGVSLDGDGRLAVISVEPGLAFGVDDPVTGLSVFDTGTSAVLARDVGAPFGTRVVSLPAGGAPSQSGSSAGGSVSADGRYVAFESSAAGLGTPAGVAAAILVRDVATGAVTLASRQDGVDGAPLAGRAFSERISADGRRIAFSVKTLDSNVIHVYVRDLASGRTLIADQSDTATPGDAASFAQGVSDDGNRVVFTSNARNLVDGINDGLQHVYVRDLAANRTFLVDRQSGDQGTPADHNAETAAISGDGRTVAFATVADLLAGGDGNKLTDVYVRHIDAPFDTRLVSSTAQGAPGDRRSFASSISRDGTRVAFISSATTFDGSPGGTTVFLRDLGASAPVTVAKADGAAGGTVTSVFEAALSADGQHVAFVAAPATSIAPGAPSDGGLRAYERDLTNSSTRLISRLSGPNGAPSPPQLPSASSLTDLGAIALTADGGCVAFDVQGRFLQPPASADFENVFLRAVEPNCGRPVLPQPPPPPPGSKPAVLSHLSVKPSRFYVGGRHGGTRIAFRLDKGSPVTLSFDRLLAAHRKGRRCLTTVQKGRRCTVVKRAGRLTVAHGKAGANTVRFSGKLGRHALAPGAYRLTATPLHGKAVTVRFVVTRAPKPKKPGR